MATVSDITHDADAFRRAYPGYGRTPTVSTIVADWHCMGCGADYDGDPWTHACSETPAARNDTLSSSRRTAATQGSRTEGPASADAGEGDRKSAGPRAAGATSPRGAQPSGRRVIICCYCRRRIYQVRNGEWYHRRNSSTACRPGEGSDRRATPLEITVPARTGAES